MRFLVLLMVLLGCDEADLFQSDAARLDAGGDAQVDAAPADSDVEGQRDAAIVAEGDVGPDAASDLGLDAGPDASPGLARHLPLGEAAPGERLSVEIPVGVHSALVQARGAPDGLYAITAVVGPDGEMTGAQPGEGRWRGSFNPEVALALWPTSDRPADELRPGRYTFEVAAVGPRAEPLSVEIWLKAGARRLIVRALVPPATGRPVDDPAVAQFARFLEDRLARLLEVEVEVVPTALAAEAPADLSLHSARGDLGALGELAAATLDDSPGLDVYLMGDVTDGGTSQSGFAGGIPAPFGLSPTAAGVIAVRTLLLEDFPHAVADLAAHELGHALGLYHTTEPFGDRHDPIGDTLECPLVCDRDADGVLLATECGRQGQGSPPCQGAADNLMFWTLGGDRRHTAGQRRVARGHPAIAP